MLQEDAPSGSQVPFTQWRNMSQEARKNHVIWAITNSVRPRGVSGLAEDPSTHFLVPHMGSTRKYGNRAKRF